MFCFFLASVAAGGGTEPTEAIGPTDAAAVPSSSYFQANGRRLGDPSAPVTIIEYSDFQCPFCKRFYDETFSQLNKEYIMQGKVFFVSKDFPLSTIHQEARPAAIAARCAEKQDKFWLMHDKLYNNQALLGSISYVTLAKDIGIDGEWFEACLQDQDMAAAVDTDAKEGATKGVAGTPTFFINGKMLAGAQPFSAFQAMIDGEDTSPTPVPVPTKKYPVPEGAPQEGPPAQAKDYPIPDVAPYVPRKEYPSEEIVAIENVRPTTSAEDPYPLLEKARGRSKRGQEEKPAETECNGCMVDDSCVPFGTRRKGGYCSIGKAFEQQAELGGMCENDYECKSDECSNGKCINTAGMLEQLLGWLKRLFG